LQQGNGGDLTGCDDDRLHRCRVCGLRYDEPPWGPDGTEASFDLCVCCGVQFGYGDHTKTLLDRARRDWLRAGAEWSFGKLKPENWSLRAQLKTVCSEEELADLAGLIERTRRQ